MRVGMQPRMCGMLKSGAGVINENSSRGSIDDVFRIIINVIEYNI